MDFSWPPSIDEKALHEKQKLLGMTYWIRAAHSLEKEWDYGSAITKSEVLIEQIEKKYLSALTDRSNAKFRSMMYTTLEDLSNQWINSSDLGDTPESLLGPFSREIATWICNQKGPFGLEDLDDMANADENEEDELENIPAHMKTKQGYLKDNFVVDDEEEEEVADADSEESEATNLDTDTGAGADEYESEESGSESGAEGESDTEDSDIDESDDDSESTNSELVIEDYEYSDDE